MKFYWWIVRSHPVIRGPSLGQTGDFVGRTAESVLPRLMATRASLPGQTDYSQISSANLTMTLLALV